MERDPHQLIEGCLIACYAVGLSQCFLYIRGEMAAGPGARGPGAQRRLRRTASWARTSSAPTSRVDIVLHWGAGAYVVGEETGAHREPGGQPGHAPAEAAVLPGGHRACTASPPSSTTSRRCPTCRGCMRNGAEAYTAIGTETLAGHPHGGGVGPREAPRRVRGRQRHHHLPRPALRRRTTCGGIRDGSELKAFVPGGGSAPWFVPEQLDLPFESRLVGAAGSMLGSGAIMVMDATTDIPAARAHARALLRPRVVRQVHALPRGRHVAGAHPRPHRRTATAARATSQLLLDVGDIICPGTFPHAASTRLGLTAVPFPYQMTTICFVGPSAFAPVHSALTLFPEEFEAKITRTRLRSRVAIARGGRHVSDVPPAVRRRSTSTSTADRSTPARASW